MYLLEFVNLVRSAQGCAPLRRMPRVPGGAVEPLEVAMGCRLEIGRMRMRSAEIAAAVARATGLPLGVDRVTLGLPPELKPHGERIAACRSAHDLPSGA